jgi:cytochrome c
MKLEIPSFRKGLRCVNYFTFRLYCAVQHSTRRALCFKLFYYPGKSTMKFLRFAWFSLISLVMSQAALAGGFSKDDAQGMVKKAAESFKAGGKEKLVAAVNTPKGPYDKGELYVFLYDMSGTTIAHPSKPDLVGKNNYQVPDEDGKLYRKEIVDNAKQGKSGWVEYKTKNPTTGKLENKIAYYEPVGDLIAVAGIFKQ